jgi:hypothetical protein
MTYCPKLQFPPPANWQDFELFCWNLWKTVWGDPDTQRHGRSGRPQHGVDIYGRPNRGQEWAGVQCKGKENFTKQQLTESELFIEVEKAKKFEPPLSAFIIATTAPRDERIQKAARKLTTLHIPAGLFTVTVYAWNDIEELILEYKPSFAMNSYPSLSNQPSNAEILKAIYEVGNRKLDADTKPPHPSSKEISSVRRAKKPGEHDAGIPENSNVMNLIGLEIPKDAMMDNIPATAADIKELSAKLDQIKILLSGQVITGDTSSDTTLTDALRRANARGGESLPQDMERGGISGSPNIDFTRSEPVAPIARRKKTQRETTMRVSQTLSAESATSKEPPLYPAHDQAVSSDEKVMVDVLALSDRIHWELLVWNYDNALAIVEGLERAMQNGDIPAGAIMPELLFLLARVHVNRAETKKSVAKVHIKRAESLLAQIESMPSESVDAQMEANIEALKGSIENLEKGPDAALARLAERTDPYAIRIRLAMLLNKQDLDGAVALVEGLPPNDRWCDLAVTAFALKERFDEAEKLVKWAAAYPSKYPQCVVRFADALLARAIAGQEKGKNIQPHDLSEVERKNVSAVLEALRPVLDPIIAKEHIDSELDTAALTIAWRANHLLGQRDGVAKLTRLMYTRRPVPMDVARNVVSGYIEPPPDLPERLREDHPSDFEANVLAAVIQTSFLSQHEEAFTKAKELISLADTVEKKEELFKLFQQIWQELEGDAVSECEQIVASLVSHNLKLYSLFEASKALRAGDPDAAIRELDKEKAEDDIYWLQLRANALMEKGQLSEAVDSLLIAAKMTREPTLLRRTAEMAFQAEKINIASWCYERLLEIQPDNLVARGNLAYIYTFHLHDIRNAAVQFRALHEAEPENPGHTVNLAVCLAQLYRPQESLALFNEACGLDKPDIRAILGRAQLHMSLGDPDAAFVSLQGLREGFWNDHNFLMAFMDAAYAAGDEEAAHDALQALNKLQVASGIDPNVFKMLPEDEGIEILKKRMKDTRERAEYVHTEMLRGRMPWVWAEQVAGNAIYWGWRWRTQELTWINDNPANRANFCIYATNAFHVRKSERNHQELLPLECPPEGTPIVADISALITLHRLELLDIAADYFGEIIVPEGYLPTVLEDSRKMVLSQRSRQQSAEQIMRKVEKGIITVIPEQTEQNADVVVVDEHGESKEHRYHLIDLIQPVYEAGNMSDSEYERISKVCAKKPGVDEAHPVLTRLQDVLVKPSTLRTLFHFGMIDAISVYYKIHITEEARIEIWQELEAINHQEETLKWHFDLWNRLRDDTRFQFVSHTLPDKLVRKDADPKDYLSFLGSFVAWQMEAPLLADDRVCQVLTLNERPEAAYAAFSTDNLISALKNAGKIDMSKAAESLRQLMQWRYRFILPSAETLKAFVEQYRTSPPGQPLQELAEYVHDCMRDTGLFGGPEKTEKGESMAMRLYLSWLSVISKFIVRVWDDESFSEISAKRLTEWSIQELLPSSPRVLHGNIKVRISSLTPRALLSDALIQSATLPKGERMPETMKALKEALKLNDDEYLDIVTEIINVAKKTES